MEIVATTPQSTTRAPAATRAPAGNLGIAAVVLGAVGCLLGATLIWFFVALPLGLAAIVLALLEQRRAPRAAPAPPTPDL